MAVRPQHIHDGGIVERRLRPIYDWLDNGNNKKALQEAEKVLKKSPTLQAARALKALALFRLGKRDEAHTVLDALAEEKPSDDTTLQAMTISYRESQQLNKVCALYEAAVKAEPTSEELHSHLFMSHVRVGDHRAQQRVAMALYKFAPKNPYYFWAVMSIILQAKSTEDPTKKGILLSLAQRMVENFITENKMEAEQEARLYIMILELQEKWEDILKFIEGSLYTQLVPGSNAPASIKYLKKLGQWRRLNLICKELLWDNQDRWDYYLPYFDSVFQLMKNPDTDCDSTVDDTAEKCHEFICQLVESMSSGRTLRGPYLARLELWKRLSEDGDPTALLGSSVALCVQYLRVFANKPCAVPDLRPYLTMIPEKERRERCKDFLTCLGLDENTEPDTAEQIQKHISCISAWRLVSEKPSGEESLSLAKLLRRHYLRCVKLGLITSTQTEFCAADMYGVLAAHHYFYAAMHHQNASLLVEAVCLLEMVLQHSPANFHVKLLLISLYHVLGDAYAAERTYGLVEAKHVQLVSLGWAHAARLPAALAPQPALCLLADTRAFHTHHGKDSVEHLTYAYKYGTFEKVVELGAWGARVEACAWCALAARDRALLALAAGPPPRAPPAPLAPVAPSHPPLTDNRDLKAIVSWEPLHCIDHDLKSRTFDQEVAYLMLKDSLVSSVTLCMECAKDSRPLEERRPQCAELRTCIQTFETNLDKYKDTFNKKEKISISGPLPSRIIAFVNSPIPYRELYRHSFSAVCALCEGKPGEARGHWASLQPMLEASRETIAAVATPDPWTLRDNLETFSNYLEFISVLAFLLGVCHELVTPATTKKSKKKANQSPEQTLTSDCLSKLNDSVQTCIAMFDHVFDDWPNIDYKLTLEEEFNKLEISNYYSTVEQKLKSDHQELRNNMKTLLAGKIAYLKSLQ